MNRKIAYVAVLILAGLGFVRAAAYRFQEKEQAIREAFTAQLQKMGLTRATAKGKYPTPYINLVSSGCLLPGGTGDVTVKGNFSPGAKVVFESDDIEVVKESLVGGEYRATLKIAPGIGPKSVPAWAMAPSMLSERSTQGVSIGGKYEWTLDAANGWRIVARSAGDRPCGGESDDTYEMQFFRKGETTPFQKRQATLNYTLYQNTYRFNISRDDPAAMGGAQEYKNLMMKLMDPNLTTAQRQQISTQIQKAQQAMMASMQQMASAASIQKREAERQQFGCEQIELKAQANVHTGMKGELRCAPAVGNGVAVTAAMKFLGR